MNPQAFADDDSLEQPKVLLVDDDEVNLLLTAIALRERGFAVTEVASGEAAITDAPGGTLLRGVRVG